MPRTPKDATAAGLARISEQLLKDTAVAIDAAPSPLAPATTLMTVETALAELRQRNFASLFQDEDEMQRAYRALAERIVMQLMTLLSATLDRLAVLQAQTPDEQLSMKMLRETVEALGRLVTQVKPPSPAPKPDAQKTDPELDAEIEELEAEVGAVPPIGAPVSD